MAFTKRDIVNLEQLNELPTEKKATIVMELVQSIIDKSSTRESLKDEGYPESGYIEQTIRSFQQQGISAYEQALNAMETGCGNCQEMAYAGALILRSGGYKGPLQIGMFGLNHAFLIVNHYIVDAWAGKCYLFHDWKENILAYGGSVSNGIMKGRVLPPHHFELEDEIPEVSLDVPENLADCLPDFNSQLHLNEIIHKHLLKFDETSHHNVDNYRILSPR